jgi:hypothetical protein
MIERFDRRPALRAQIQEPDEKEGFGMCGTAGTVWVLTTVTFSLPASFQGSVRTAGALTSIRVRR